MAFRTAYLIESAEFLVEDGQHPERSYPSGLVAGVRVKVLTEFVNYKRPVRSNWRTTREKEKISGAHREHEG